MLVSCLRSKYRLTQKGRSRSDRCFVRARVSGWIVGHGLFHVAYVELCNFIISILGDLCVQVVSLVLRHLITMLQAVTSLIDGVTQGPGRTQVQGMGRTVAAAEPDVAADGGQRKRRRQSRNRKGIYVKILGDLSGGKLWTEPNFGEGCLLSFYTIYQLFKDGW